MGVVGTILVTIAFCVATSLDAETVRIASFNVRNYTATDRVIDKEWTPDYPKPEDEKAALRTVLKEVNADVVVFQEMGPAEYLEELRLDLAREGVDYPYSAHLVAEDGERCLAGLSKIPFERVGRVTDLSYSIEGKKYSVKRGLISLSFKAQGRELTVYDAHLKSRAGPASESQRNEQERHGEATAIRNHIMKEQASEGALWLLAGDMNDTPGTGTWNRLTNKGEKQVGVDLRPLDSNGEAWTYFYKRKDVYERIDILLASSKLAEGGVKHGARVYDGKGSDTASDHRLIYVDLDFGDEQVKTADETK